MTRIIFIEAKGRTEATGAPDQNLLDVAQAAGMPLEGTCEGQMACSTCHVIIADAAVFAALPRASESEEDMLDLAAGACRTSRLACQISISDLPDGIEVRIPGESQNMQGL
jgi:ferredoxin-2, mitochondrial